MIPNNTTDLQIELTQKIKKATNLSTKHSFPLSMFKTYDPQLAGDLYEEAANITFNIGNYQNTANLLQKSLQTYLLIKDRTGKHHAAQISTKIAELYASNNFYNHIKAIEAFLAASEYYKLTGSYSIAASKCVCAAKLAILHEDYECAERAYGNAIELYDIACMPMNRVLLLNEFLGCLIRNGNYFKAGNILVEMASVKNVSNNCDGYLLMAWCCYFVTGDDRMDVYEVLGVDCDIVDCVRNNEMERVNEMLVKRVSRMMNKDVFMIVVEMVLNHGCVVDTR